MDSLKTILIAEPTSVIFHNCELLKNYTRTVILRNIDVELARFKIKSRPAKSVFVIFIKTTAKDGKDNIAPGMHAKLLVHYYCDSLIDYEELLTIGVQNGKYVTVKIQAKRDPPILRALEEMSLPPFLDISSDESSSSNSYSMNSSDLSLNGKSLSSDESYSESYTYSSNDSVYAGTPFNGIIHSSFDCKKCFVGEFVIILTLLENIGGKGRFFIMSEMDWCSMQMKDLTARNMLIVSPFAIRPAYFSLDSGEQLTLHTYFFPDSYGLQVDELYMISDNGGVKTIEIIGDGIMFEPQLLQFDKVVHKKCLRSESKKNVKYQWFETKNGESCTIRYFDLGSGEPDSILQGTFTVTNKCDLDMYYNWKMENTILCPAEYKKNTVSRREFCLEDLNIEPSAGVFKSNSIVKFNMTARLCKYLVPARYRATLRLVIEDIPLAAVPKRYNFSCEDSQTKRRLCQHPVDLTFESIEIRIQCTSANDQEKIIRIKDAEVDHLATMSIMDFTDVVENAMTMRVSTDENPLDSSSSARSDDVCRFIKGYGTCDCCESEIMSTAVVRPDRPLYVGVESKFHAVLCNASSRRVKFWWGNTVGRDHTKVKIQIKPKFDFIMPYSKQTIRLHCLPLETGEISQIFIPCQFDGLNPVNLCLECTVLSLQVIFHFPPVFEESTLVFGKIDIEWSANEYISRLDKKTGEIKLVKPKLKEEKLLHRMSLLGDESQTNIASQIKSSCNSYENEGETSDGDTLLSKRASANEVEINNSSELMTSLESWLEENETPCDDETENLQILPYFDYNRDLTRKLFHYRPVIVEFYVVPGKNFSKRIYIENSSPIESYFSVTTKNHWVAENQEEDNNLFMGLTSELISGVKLEVSPKEGTIEPNQLLYVDIIASSNTWGIYTDKIIVNINLLPPFIFWVRIINQKSPIFYPVCRNSRKSVPHLRFTVFKSGCSAGKRKLLIENTSILPLYINWHCFSMDQETKSKPFNVIFDLITPFLEMDEFFETNGSFYNAFKKYLSCAWNAYESKTNEVENINSNTLSSDDNNFFLGPTKIRYEDLFGNPLSASSDNDSTNMKKTAKSRRKTSKKLKNTEFQLSMVPFYGDPMNDLFLISPKELFINPHEKRYIYISVNTDKLHELTNRVVCRACGFIRIPPILKFKDNVFFRKDGYYLPPTEVILQCDIKEPVLSVQPSNSQRTFEFYTKDFLQQTKSELCVEQKIFLRNSYEEIVDVLIDVRKPFQVINVSTQREKFCCRMATVHPGDTIEITIQCEISKKWIESYLIKQADNENKFATSFLIDQPLTIKYKDGFEQSVSLYIKINVPSLKITTGYLNFGAVNIADAKTLTFGIQNISERAQYFEIQDNNDDIFLIYPKKSLLGSQNIKEVNELQISVHFIPRYAGSYEKTIEIYSEVDGLASKIFLTGCAYM